MLSRRQRADRSRGRLAGLLLVATALTALITGSARAEIAIGSAGPLSGQWTGTGEQQRRGVEMAVADLNARGGVLGQRLRGSALTEDDRPRQMAAGLRPQRGKGEGQRETGPGD